MFNKLKISLVIVNLSVIIIIFLFLSVGTYFFVQNRMKLGDEHLMKTIASDLAEDGIIFEPPRTKFKPPFLRDDNSSEFKPPPFGKGVPLVFFAKLDSLNDFKIESTSQFMPLSTEELKLLISKTIDKKNNRGIISHEDEEYSYSIVSSDGEQYQNQKKSVYILFHNLSNDQDILQLLVTALSSIGVVCVILSLLGSLFMANRAIIPIQNAWLQQKNFLADASHELRTPLTIIRVNLEIVRENLSQTVESQSQWLDNIYEGTISMTKLIESLFFLAQADSKQQILSKEWFLLNNTVLTATSIFSSIASKENVKLNCVLENNMTYYGDELKIRQVMNILLDNAIRHTKGGDTVTVKTRKTPSKLEILVINPGEGISKEHLGKIFDRFYQIDSSRSKGKSGLGLSIAKWIVESHNGQITVSSTQGETVFTVSLPI